MSDKKANFITADTIYNRNISAFSMGYIIERFKSSCFIKISMVNEDLKGKTPRKGDKYYNHEEAVTFSLTNNERIQLKTLLRFMLDSDEFVEEKLEIEHKMNNNIRILKMGFDSVEDFENGRISIVIDTLDRDDPNEVIDRHVAIFDHDDKIGFNLDAECFHTWLGTPSDIVGFSAVNNPLCYTHQKPAYNKDNNRDYDDRSRDYDDRSRDYDDRSRDYDDRSRNYDDRDKKRERPENKKTRKRLF